MLPMTAADWKNVRGYVDILKPFHDATKIEEGESYITLSLIIPVLTILYDKTKAYYQSRDHAGYGITFARKILASLKDRFGKYPNFLLSNPHCLLATYSDPRFAKIYYSRKPQMEQVRETVEEWVKEEFNALIEEQDAPIASALEAQPQKDFFWSALDQHLEDDSEDNATSIDSEMQRWKGLSAPSRTSNPILIMESLKKDYPCMYKIFRKYSIFPATQNKDERLFSMVGRNTGPHCRKIKAETIEKKVIVGSAIQKHGFIFNFNDCKSNCSSSDEADSF